MKSRVEISFPLAPDGPLGRASQLASEHPSRSVASGEDGAPFVNLALDPTQDWRLIGDLSAPLRGEPRGRYRLDGEAVSHEELFGGLRCFLRKQRSGRSAKDWCTPKSQAGRQLFPCKQIRVYDNEHLTENSWYSFGEMGKDGVFRVDKEAVTERVLSDLGPCVRCPILDLDLTAELVARLPETIDPSSQEGWSYRKRGEDPGRWKVVKARPEETKPVEGRPDREPRESLIERLARNVRSGGAGVAAASGVAPGTRNIPKTRYRDVGGMRDTIALVREAVELPITHPELFERLGIRPHRGILFHGPPGTGKTLLARAAANESGAHFIAVSGPEILNKFWGQSEAKLRSIFAEARAKAPSIVLFDEIDSFASARDSMSESFEATLVSQLLSLMDGMNDLGRVCVIATTNRPSALDPALRRPGRFDHEVEIGLPDPESRLHILSIHARDMPTAPELDLKEIARHTEGYSGADLEALCREAALACMRRTVDLTDLDRRVTNHELSSLSVTTYDFRNAMKRVGASIRR
ncbi:ATPase family associated with various cellular activities (AAA) [Rubrobacter radiotolerans]|uniref:AAA family ATPase n=1 Tax=Rubrobacter radiotolerans TaxID=42256 RepID=A0A023X7G2_RUBRA|nr:AAA family ATPase [Rubrobacter radiotolerans]AHY47975.1 ATPase family associated with various cellular activities (AAA) [Rubrobacter radiotolerans]MDX5892613.1 AAA family ATPase [Rubrobacter radiotolerans]SMC07929.1 transitional endoplasmic reticulum ATPase [Rubrobacter radiotolerans DSM 5868]